MVLYQSSNLSAFVLQVEKQLTKDQKIESLNSTRKTHFPQLKLRSF